MFATITVVCAEPWDGSNNPASFQGDRNLNLAAFPTRADVSPTPWSDTYWPSYEGGIANRWNGDGKGFDYHLNTKDELQAGSVDIGTLSPAEKFDIYNGRYDYPLLNSEWQRVHPSDASWEGLCHGWAPAAYLFNQPGQAVLTNPDGIKVPFFSSDVKALLTYLMAQYGESSETDFLGTRCNTDLSANPAGENSTECRDINAGSILAIFGNQLGLKTQAFVADVDRGYQVWNQPISGYALELGSTRPCSTGASRSCQHEQEVQVAMSYTQETVPQTTAHDALTRQANYDLWVELDASGNIVGGWHNTWKRPDFVWTETRKDFSGYFAKLADVYAATTPNASTRLAAMPAAPHKTATRLPAGHGTFGLAAYRDAPHSVSWCVPAAPNGLRVSFDYLDTRRFRDTVTVYEADAECRRGAPVTVLHGPEHIHKLLTAQVPRGSGALITFTVDPRAGRAVSGSVGKGFRAHYENL